ncbi:LamG-like jellyroll fold domain-containing protein [Streptomyces sp. NRRL S-813]|uniref:LamG-like jellyroll fold domain-containing protein n=1 Tax=Streptomyces sp. NRRL S-813 TaxID=1463919 RepID=UPI0004BF11FC|nr:LamG-like jellyroll fold domain-containing protein [Streptomyces sp. NRRL S-813]
MPLLAEMGWGGLVQYPDTITWTDISQYVNQVQGVTITRGASDELSDAQPGTATLTLDNVDGRFTPGNAASPYYPFVRRNAPVRISVAIMPTRSGPAPYPLAQLADDFDNGVVDPALWTVSGGAVEAGGRLRLPMTPDGAVPGFSSLRQWTLTGSKLTAKFATVPAAGGSSSASVSMYVLSQTSGTRFRWRYTPINNELRAMSEVGSSDASPTVLTYNPIAHAWLRIREASGTVYFETSGDGFGWTVQRSLPTPAWVTTDQVQAQFAATRSGGTADVAEFDLVGAEIRPRFWGMVNEFPIDWQGLVSTVQVSCTDLFKRLNRLPTLRSMLAEEIITQDFSTIDGVVSAYYPLTEAAGATAAGDVSGSACPSLAVTQVGAGGTLAFGSDGVTETDESSALVTPSTATAGQYLTGDLGPTFQDRSNTYPQIVEAWIKTTTPGRAILGLYEPSLDHQFVLALNGSGVLTVEYTADGSALTVHTSNSGNLADGNWHHIVHDMNTRKIYVDGAFVNVTALIPDMYALRTLHVGGYRGARLFSGQIAHVAVMHVDGDIGAALASTHYAAGTTGCAGETADVRIERLARYAGVSSVTVWGSLHDPIASQGPAGSTVVARMRDVESTESARLFAERDWYGLAYQSRDLRYNPDPASEVFTIDYADLETGRVELADDDQKLINSVEASRPGGATQKVTAPSSIVAFGVYDPGSMSILKTSDNSVLDAAYWLVSRYANPEPELREVPIEAYTMPNYLDILDADISTYFSVNNMPSQAPADSMRVTVEGYTETIKERSHLIQFHTSTTITDSVWVLDDPTYSVLDSTTRLAY